MTDEDHRQLAEVLHGIQGRAIVSGYTCPLYEELYPNWQQVEQSALTTSGEKRVECLWLSTEHPKVVQVKLQFSLPEVRLREPLEWLEQERDLILKGGPVAENGTWIETCKVSKRKGWRQAMWKSNKPVFTPKRQQGDSEALCKTQYIGKVGSPRHQKALAAISRRKQLSHINKQISQLQEVV